MPGETRRNLRSNKDASSSSSAQGSSSKDKGGPARSAASKSKPAAGRKNSKDTSADKPKANGQPVENGVNGAADTDMAGADQDKGKDADEEMTVVVPPPNSSKLSAEPGKDGEGDETMDDAPSGDEQSEEEADPRTQTITSIKANFGLLERAVVQFDGRFTLRVLRSISSMRKHLTGDILAEVLVETYPPSNKAAQSLLDALERPDAFSSAESSSDMELDGSGREKGSASKQKDLIPEIDIYLAILVQVVLFDTKAYEYGASFSAELTVVLRNLNRRTLDSLAAKVYFYYALFYERLAPAPPTAAAPLVAIRPTLLAALRTAVLRKDQDTQATVTTLLLRNYLATSHITQADLLISHSAQQAGGGGGSGSGGGRPPRDQEPRQFPAGASNNQIARYYYYLGRIRAIQLSYSEAHEHLVAATRKAPTSASARGFAQAATKLLIVVELLMGDIPDRALFRPVGLERALQPYLQLVQAIRIGDLKGFERIVGAHEAAFRRAGTHTLILRLRQNVIKTGIRMMSLSYAKISLRDICLRLSLPSEQTAEYIVAKAIRDGVIEASLDHERGFMRSKDVGDVYATREPGEAFHERIRACLDLHDESVKAMRFPMNQHRLELKNAQEARERERELAKEIVEGEMDDDDAGGDFEGM